jgi:hypothetical protein
LQIADLTACAYAEIAGELPPVFPQSAVPLAEIFGYHIQSIGKPLPFSRQSGLTEQQKAFFLTTLWIARCLTSISKKFPRRRYRSIIARTFTKITIFSPYCAYAWWIWGLPAA